jgi:2-oxoglutarate dehydrogenase E2 component (dihydrolipoamide succinyltransferase)
MPAAAKILADNNLSAANVAGTGKDGRVTKGDALGAIKAGGRGRPQPLGIPTGAPTSAAAGGGPGRPEPGRPSRAARAHDRLRARIAERLLQSQSTNAILTTFNEVNMAPVMDCARSSRTSSRRSTA